MAKLGASGRSVSFVLAACVAGVLGCVPDYRFDGSPDTGTGGMTDAAAQDATPAPELDASMASSMDGGVDAPPDAPFDDGGPLLVEAGAGCFQTLMPADQGAAHVPIGTHFPYNSDPPASGSHYPIWAAFQEFTTPVDYGYLVHDLEHGALVFFYRCPSNAPCDEVMATVRSAAASVPNDPACDAPDSGTGGPGIHKRVVIVPSASMDVPIAAAAWDHVYKADCIDLPSLVAFASAHYGQGLEGLCTPGQTSF